MPSFKRTYLLIVVAGLLTYHQVLLASQSASQTVTLNLAAQINIRTATDVSLYITTKGPMLYTLFWDPSRKTFSDINVSYHLESNSASSNLNSFKYRVGLRSVDLYCQTKMNYYPYVGIDASGASGFKAVTLTLPTGVQSFTGMTSNTDLISGGSNDNYLGDSVVYASEVVMSDGSLHFEFPDLSTEAGEGGANCTGGAVFVIYPSI